MLDSRLKTLAKSLVNYSTKVKQGDVCLIQGYDTPPEFIAAIVDEVWAKGGKPFVKISSSKINSHLTPHYTEEYIKEMTEINEHLWNKIQVYISVDGSDNAYNGSNVPTQTKQLLARISNKRFHEITDANNVRWVILEYPNPTLAQNARMTTEQFEDFYLQVCNTDYEKMNKAMQPLKELMEKTDKVHIKSPTTDLTFSIKGQTAVPCAGECNIPDGEVFTSPIKESVNGTVEFNVPCSAGGKVLEKIKFEVKDGKIINSNSTEKETLDGLLNTDDGARYFGEFALGVNPYVKQPMLDTLWDEKISGSFHMAFGTCLPDSPNGNESAVHYDLIQIQTPEYGGGEIWFDDVLIRKDGMFVLPELEGLNPENLK
ncbi:MAG: aminopeptidase [Clostridia bacterium]|nr:aminopeptidase [Clostridia bacterium]